MNSLHQVTIDRVTYDCSVSHALEPFLEQAREFGIDSVTANLNVFLQPTRLNQTREPSPPPISRNQPSSEEKVVDPLNLFRPTPSSNRDANGYQLNQIGAYSASSAMYPSMLSSGYGPNPMPNSYNMNGFTVPASTSGVFLPYSVPAYPVSSNGSYFQTPMSSVGHNEQMHPYAMGSYSPNLPPMHGNRLF